MQVQIIYDQVAYLPSTGMLGEVVTLRGGWPLVMRVHCCTPRSGGAARATVLLRRARRAPGEGIVRARVLRRAAPAERACHMILR